MFVKSLNRFIEMLSLITPPGLEYFLTDGHHSLLELNTQFFIMLNVLNGKIDEEDLQSIDNMYYRPDFYIIQIINKIILFLKRKGYSAKQINIFGQYIFAEAYEQRLSLFRDICNKYPNLAFKTKKHFNEENDPMFSGNFLAGINTPLGITTFHIKLDQFDDFTIPEIERGPKYEGYTTQEALYRLSSIIDEQLVLKHVNKTCK